MATGSITTIRELVDEGLTWAVGTAQDLDDAKLKWTYVEDHVLVPRTQRLQVRTSKEVAPKYEVSKYAQMMKQRKHLPPVVTTLDGWLVDGNTRTEAATNLGWKSYPAFVINVVWGSLSPDSAMRKKLLKLGGAQNEKHGRRMSTAAMAVLIRQVTDDMDSPKLIAAELNIPMSTAVTVMNAAKVQRKAADLGIEIAPSLSNSHMKVLGGKLEKWTTPVFEGVLTLTQDAHLTIPEMEDVAKRVEALDTEQQRLNLIKEIAAQHRSSISTGQRQTPAKSRRLKQTLGYLLAEGNTPASFVELDPDKDQEMRDYLLRAEMKLRETRLAQEEVIASRQLAKV